VVESAEVLVSEIGDSVSEHKSLRLLMHCATDDGGGVFQG